MERLAVVACKIPWLEGPRHSGGHLTAIMLFSLFQTSQVCTIGTRIPRVLHSFAVTVRSTALRCEGRHHGAGLSPNYPDLLICKISYEDRVGALLVWACQEEL